MKAVIAILVVSVAFRLTSCYLVMLPSHSHAAEYTLLDGTDCKGHDIGNYWKDTTLQNCMTLCSVRHDCKSFQFNANDNCYLKNYACSAGEMRDYPTAKMYNKVKWDTK